MRFHPERGLVVFFGTGDSFVNAVHGLCRSRTYTSGSPCRLESLRSRGGLALSTCHGFFHFSHGPFHAYQYGS